jgi:hypothetical protein
MNKFLFHHCFKLYYKLSSIRIAFYLLIGNQSKAEAAIITEHYKWRKK